MDGYGAMQGKIWTVMKLIKFNACKTLTEVYRNVNDRIICRLNRAFFSRPNVYSQWIYMLQHVYTMPIPQLFKDALKSYTPKPSFL